MFDHQLDRVYQALASTNRRWLLERLSEEPASVLELAEIFPMTLRGVLQHVRLLERAGLLRTSKIGRVRICTVHGDTLLAAERWLRHTRGASQGPRLSLRPRDLRRLGMVDLPEGE